MKNRNDDVASNKRILIKAKAGDDICLPVSLNKAISLLKKAKAKASKNKFEDITVDYSYEEGDENNLTQSYIIVTGKRIETEKEWHKRLEHRRNVLKRSMDNAERVTNNLGHYKQEVSAINKALEKSSLKCEMCGSPTSMSVYHDSKDQRLCEKCLSKLFV